VKCLQIENNIVATGSVDATVRIWDLSQSDTYGSIPSNAISMTSYSPTSSEDELEIQNTPSQLAPGPNCCVDILDSHVSEVTALHMQGDTLVSGSADKTLRQWDLSSGRCVQTLDVIWAAAQSAQSMSIEETRTRFATAGRNKLADFVGALQCFDAALACGTADGMVRLWDCMIQ